MRGVGESEPMAMNKVLSGCAVRAALQIEQDSFQSKDAFENYIRDLRRPDIGDDANDMTEADYVLDLAEPGWPDSAQWCAIWVRIKDGGELTPREREQALHYYCTDDGDGVPEQFRF